MLELTDVTDNRCVRHPANLNSHRILASQAVWRTVPWRPSLLGSGAARATGATQEELGLPIDFILQVKVTDEMSRREGFTAVLSLPETQLCTQSSFGLSGADS